MSSRSEYRELAVEAIQAVQELARKLAGWKAEAGAGTLALHATDAAQKAWRTAHRLETTLACLDGRE